MRRLPTAARLWLASALCLVPLGLVWSTTVLPGTVLYGDCGYSEGPYCVPDQYVPGGTHTLLVSQAPIRLFLVFAVLALAICASHRRTESTRLLARLGTASIAVAGVLALAQGASRVLLCLVAALILAAPPAWRRILASAPAAR